MTDAQEERMTDDWSDEDTEDVFDNMNQIGRLITSAYTDTLRPPVSKELDFTGDKAEAMGSARFVAERISDKSDYNTETEYVGETKSILEEDERHTIRVIVTERT